MPISQQETISNKEPLNFSSTIQQGLFFVHILKLAEALKNIFDNISRPYFSCTAQN